MSIRSPARRHRGRGRRGNRVAVAPPGPRSILAAVGPCGGFRQRRVTRIAATARQASGRDTSERWWSDPYRADPSGPSPSRQANHGREHIGSPSSAGRSIPINQGLRQSSPTQPRNQWWVAAAAWPAAGPVRATLALRGQLAQRGELPVTENLPDHDLDRSSQRDSQEGPDHAEQRAAK
jgi:hypothetical protein